MCSQELLTHSHNISLLKMKKLCICEICSCGRHRCPHKPTALYGTDNTNACVVTEYAEKFPHYRGYNPPQSMKPKPDLDQTRDRPRLNGVTTFKSDFQPHEVTRHPARQKTEYQPNPEKLESGTTYNQEFNRYEIQAFVPVKPRERIYTINAKLDTVPTYKDDFKPWEICKRKLIKPENNYQPSSAKFCGSTTFQDDFVPRPLAPRENFKPPNVAKLSEVPFDTVTSHQLSFVPHPVEARFVRPPDTYRPSSQPLQDLTTNRQDFRGLPGELPQSCKPSPNKYSSLSAEVPFQDSTENKEKFKVWPVCLPQLRKREEYVIPTVQMDLSTTSAADYIMHHIQPFISARPYAPPKRSSAPFQKCTTMREDFQPWLVPGRQPIIKMNDEMHKPTGKMEDLSTFRAHFPPHELRPTISFKPSNQPMRTDVPMEDCTMYRTEFTPKSIIVCPAGFDSPPGFVFEESDERGHRYYRKLSPKDNNQTPGDAVVPVQKALAVL